MPRPLNWIRGEGTTKNQRWGLGSLQDTPFIPKLGFSGLGDIVVGDGTFAVSGGACPGSPGCPGYVRPYDDGSGDIAYIESLQDELRSLYSQSSGSVDTYFNQQVNANNYATWISQNLPLIVAGGIVGLLLFRR